MGFNNISSSQTILKSNLAVTNNEVFIQSYDRDTNQYSVFIFQLETGFLIQTISNLTDYNLISTF
jgi:hypothetical protein